GIIHAANLDAAGANYLVLRHRQLHVINTEVGEELRIEVKLVAIPGAVPPNSNLGKPLTAENKVAIPPGTRHSLGKLIVEFDLELHIPIGWDGLRQVHLNYGAIVLVVVIGMHKLQLRSEFALAHDFKALDLLRAVALGIPLS